MIFGSNEQGAVLDELPWQDLLDSGLVGSSSGGLLATYGMQGPDHLTASSGARAGLTTEVYDTLRDPDSSLLLAATVSRSESMGYQRSLFPGENSQIIEDERAAEYAAAGEHYESRHFLSVHYQPPRLSNAVDRFVAPAGAPEQWSDRVVFANKLRRFESGLPSLRLGRLGHREVADAFGKTYVTDDLVNFLWFCYSGEWMAHRLPESGHRFLAYMMDGEFVPGRRMRVGNEFVAVVAVRGFAAGTQNDMLAPLNDLPLTYRMTQSAQFLTEAQAIHIASLNADQHKQASVSFLSRIMGNSRSVETRVSSRRLYLGQSAQQAVAAAESGEPFFFWKTHCVLRARDERVLDAGVDTLVQTFRDCGYKAYRTGPRTTRTFFASMPGNIRYDWSRAVVRLRSLIHVLPITSTWAGPETHPSPRYPKNSPPLGYASTSGATPFRICTFDDDLGHAVINGPGGAGKTFLQTFLLSSHLRYPGAQVIAFDRQNQMYGYAMALWADGTASHTSIDSNAKAGLPFFDRLFERPRRTRAQNVLHAMMRGGGIQLTPEIRSDLDSALDELAGAQREGSRTPSTLAILQGYVNTPVIADVFHNVLNSELGPLYRLPPADLDDRPVQFIEMERLLKIDAFVSIPTLVFLVDYLFARINGRAPSMMIFDEFPQLFKDDYLFNLAETAYREGRSRNLAILAAAQDTPAFATTKIGQLALLQSPTRFACADPEATQPGQGTPGSADHIPGPADHYERCGYSADGRDIIANQLKRKRDYLFVLKGQAERPFTLQAGPITTHLLAPPGDVKRSMTSKDVVDEKIRLHGTEWVRPHLAEVADEAWMRHYDYLRSPFGATRQGERIA